MKVTWRLHGGYTEPCMHNLLCLSVRQSVCRLCELCLLLSELSVLLSVCLERVCYDLKTHPVSKLSTQPFRVLQASRGLGKPLWTLP